MSTNDAGLMYVVFKLIELGLSLNMIDHAMKKMAGADWQALSLSQVRSRLCTNGFHLRPDMSLIIDEFEALIIGTIKLEDIYAEYS